MNYKGKPIKIGLVDDHKLFRKGLVTLIGLVDQYNYLVTLEADNGREMIRKLDKKALPDIMLLDIDMPDMDGYETMSWLKVNHPNISVLVISMVDSEESIARMMRLGVKGYLGKDIEVEDMHKALQSISNKGYYYTDFLTGKLIDALNNDGQTSSIELQGKGAIGEQINENERKFLTLACSELKYEEIAEKMFLSPKTVDGYRAALFARFNIKNRSGLILFAIKNGFVNVDEL